MTPPAVFSLGDDEPELIRRAKAGDETAFGLLVEAHSGRVYLALLRFGLDAGDAEAVAQEVFLRAWRGLATFEGHALLSTWLYRITFNEAHRRLARRGPVDIGGAEDGNDPVTLVPENPERGPEARALKHEFDGLLLQALAQLPAEQRIAVILRDIDGLSTEAAAKVVGVRPVAFKSRLHRGRMELRVLLGPYLAGTAV